MDVDQSEVFKESTHGCTDMSINMNKVDARGVHMSIFYVTTLGMGCIKERLDEGDISSYMGRLNMPLLRSGQQWPTMDCKSNGPQPCSPSANSLLQNLRSLCVDKIGEWE